VIIRSGVRLKDISASINGDGSVIRGKVTAKLRGDWAKWLGECGRGRENGQTGELTVKGRGHPTGLRIERGDTLMSERRTPFL